MNLDTSQCNLIDLEDREFKPSDLTQEDKLNLFIFYNTDCLGCTGRALPFAYDLSTEYPFINLIVVHVQFGSRKYTPEDIRSVFTGKKAPFPIYRDQGNKLYDLWGCQGTPHWIFINKSNPAPSYSIFGSQEGSKLKLELAISEMSIEFS